MNGEEIHPLSVEALGASDGQGRCNEHAIADDRLEPVSNKAKCAHSESQNLLDQLPSRSLAEMQLVTPKHTESTSTFIDLSRSRAPEAREGFSPRESFARKSPRGGEEAVQIKMEQGEDDAAANMAAASSSTAKMAVGGQAVDALSKKEMKQPGNRDVFSQWEEAFQSKLDRYTQSIEDLIAKQQRELLQAVREEILEGLWSSRRKFKETLLKKKKAAAETERTTLCGDAALEKAVEKSLRASKKGRSSKRDSTFSKIVPTEGGERGSTISNDSLAGEDDTRYTTTYTGASEKVRDEIEDRQMASMSKITKASQNRLSFMTDRIREFNITMPKDAPRNCMSQVTNTRLFGAWSAGLILLNAIFIGIETDTAVKYALNMQGLPDTYGHINKAFTSLFVLELAMRLIAERSWFFLGSEWRWNFFDTVLVLSSLIQILLEGYISSMSFARILRAFRMVRATRVIKVLRFFHELRRMVSSIVSSLASLGWALLLLGLMKYLVAICFTQAAAGYLRDHYINEDSDPDNEGVVGIKKWYSSLSMSMLSLMLSISGGADWYDVAYPLEGVSKLYMVLFVFYVFFVIFGVLNVLVGVFLASAAEVMDRDVIVQSEIMKTSAAVKELHMLFNEIDKNDTGQISLQELDDYLQDEKAQAYFAWNCLDPTDPYMLFKLMDKDGDGQVDMREFIFSMMKCKGSAKGTDMRALMQEVKRTQERLELMTAALMEYPLVGCADPSADESKPQRVVSAPASASNNGFLKPPDN